MGIHGGQGDLVVRPNIRMAVVTVIFMALTAVAIVSGILIGDAPALVAPIVGIPFAVMVIVGIEVLLRARSAVPRPRPARRGRRVRPGAPRPGLHG